MYPRRTFKPPLKWPRASYRWYRLKELDLVFNIDKFVSDFDAIILNGDTTQPGNFRGIHDYVSTKD